MKKIILTAMIFCVGTVSLLNADPTDQYWALQSLARGETVSGADVVVDSYDKTIAVSSYSAAVSKLYVTKHDYDGTLVSTFGTAGTATITIGGAASGETVEIAGFAGMDTTLGPAVVVDADNKILIAFQSAGRVNVIRLLSTTGALDTDFNGTGVVSLEANNFSAGSTIHTIGGLCVDTMTDKGIFVVAGATLSDTTTKTVFVARLTSSGAMDTGFSGDGYLSLDSLLTTVESASISAKMLHTYIVNNQVAVEGSSYALFIAGQENGSIFCVKVNNKDAFIATDVWEQFFSSGKYSYSISGSHFLSGLAATARILVEGYGLGNDNKIDLSVSKGVSIYTIQITTESTAELSREMVADDNVDMQSYTYHSATGAIFISGITDGKPFVIKLIVPSPTPTFTFGTSLIIYGPVRNRGEAQIFISTTDSTGGGRSAVDDAGAVTFVSYKNSDLYIERVLGAEDKVSADNAVDPSTGTIDALVLANYKNNAQSLYNILHLDQTFYYRTSSYTLIYSVILENVTDVLTEMIAIASANSFPSCLTMYFRAGLFRNALATNTSFNSGQIAVVVDAIKRNWNQLFNDIYHPSSSLVL